MAKSKRQPIEQQPQEDVQAQEEEMQSEQSSEDDDAALLTSKVEEKLLSTLAKIKLKHPSIYDKTKTELFEDGDFDDEEKSHEIKPKKESKFTYKEMIKQVGEDSQPEENDLPIAQQQKKAKESFKNALKKNIKMISEEDGDLFKVVSKVGKKEEEQPVDEKSKFKDLTSKFDKESKKLIKKVWKSDKLLDETDLFLKDYILDKKWLTSKHKVKEDENQEIIDEEDEERSLEMDQYEAQYNFRFEEPGGTSITQYPRQVKNSLRQKPETRKEKRKKTIEKKKQQQLELRKQAEEKKEVLKKNILEKLAPPEELDHDWFFCDDCCKGLEQNEVIWKCTNCQDFILCAECNDLIIHKHPLEKERVPKGCGAPQNGEKTLQGLKSCKVCRRRIPPSKDRFQFTDRSYIVNVMCEECYDQSNLEIKKKYKRVETQAPNFADMLDQNPEKIKELTNMKEIQEMVDEYLQNDFEGVLSGGLKTKFKYINVPAESYGLSDQQILFGDDKQLNKYISVKKLAPYSQGRMRLKNSLFNKKIKSIKKSVKTNKQLLKKGVAQLNRVRLLAKMKQKATAIKQRRQKRLRIVNLSTKEKERDHFVSSSRLMSYGIKNDEGQETK